MNSSTSSPSSWTVTQAMSAVNLVFVVGSMVVYKILKQSAPYGRFSNAKPSSHGKFEWRRNQPVEAKLAWLIMELPNLVCGFSILFSAWQSEKGTPFGWLVVSLFMFHYVIRTLVYSQLLKGSKPMPLDVLSAGVLFTLVNGTVQCYHHLFEVDYHPHGMLETYTSYVRVLWGLCLFFFGFAMNQWSDAVLRGLRKHEDDKGYYIPHGFFFDYVSAPNLVGEIIEWLGYAILANTFVSYSFFVTTLFNIGARAISHHNWYLEKFEDYPKQRKALIPFVY